MEQATQQAVLSIMNKAKDLTLATVRPDGYPQATTVSYANDGLTIYIGVGNGCQKVSNIRNNNKVSLTINNDYKDWKEIKGLSMSGIAEIVDDPNTIKVAAECMLRRYPQLSDLVKTEQAKDFVFLKIQPQVISVLDYEKGFGHADLITV
jgi:general stress protein 26